MLEEAFFLPHVCVLIIQVCRLIALHDPASFGGKTCLALRRGALKMLALLYPDETAPLHDNDVPPASLHRLAADLPIYAERNKGAWQGTRTQQQENICFLLVCAFSFDTKNCCKVQVLKVSQCLLGIPIFGWFSRSVF